MVVHPLSALSGLAGGGYISLMMMPLSGMAPSRFPVVSHAHTRGE